MEGPPKLSRSLIPCFCPAGAAAPARHPLSSSGTRRHHSTLILEPPHTHQSHKSIQDDREQHSSKQTCDSAHTLPENSMHELINPDSSCPPPRSHPHPGMPKIPTPRRDSPIGASCPPLFSVLYNRPTSHRPPSPRRQSQGAWKGKGGREREGERKKQKHPGAIMLTTPEQA